MAETKDTTTPINRLPTLFEVLNLRTEPPVDLWCFYAYLRQEYHGIEYLEFWLAVIRHRSLCRRYVRGLREGIMASDRELTSSSQASSILLETLNDSNKHQLSAFLRGEDTKDENGNMIQLSALLDLLTPKDQYLAQEIEQLRARCEPLQHPNRQLDSPLSTASSPTQGTTPTAAAWAQDKRKPGGARLALKESIPESLRQKYSPDSGVHSIDEKKAASVYALPIKPELHKSQSAPTLPPMLPRLKAGEKKQQPIGNDEKTLKTDTETVVSFVSRDEISRFTHYILVTYLIPGAEHEINLPPSIMKRVRYAIEIMGRDDPEVFDDAREYVFDVMQCDHFCAFLTSKALGNTNPFGSVIRIVIGVIAMFAAFWVGFILIFLDWKPRATRVWLLLPFGVGVYFLCAGLYNLDPVLAFLGYSESLAGKWIKVREPYIRRLLVKRSVFILTIFLIITAALVCLFTFVPGKRL